MRQKKKIQIKDGRKTNYRPMLVCADALIDHIFFSSFFECSLSHVDDDQQEEQLIHPLFCFFFFFLVKKQTCIIKELSLIYIL